MAGRLVRLLEGAVAAIRIVRSGGSSVVCALSERRAILRGVERDARVRFLARRCLQLFAAQAARAAGSGCGGVRGRAAELRRALDARSSQLAHHLRAQGSVPEVVVGLCIERSLAMLVGLLGILKAGGAYLPLDPELPARASGVHAGAMPARRCCSPPRRCARIGCAAHGARASSSASMPTGGRHRARSPRPHRPSRLQPQHPAYVIYTSGSTGIPKGVAIDASERRATMVQR